MRGPLQPEGDGTPQWQLCGDLGDLTQFVSGKRRGFARTGVRHWGRCAWKRLPRQYDDEWLTAFPEIVATSDGGFVVFYEDLETYSVLGQAFDAFGARVGREFIVNTTPSTPLTFDGISAATLADGRIVVTWDRGADGSDTGIHSQIIDPRDGLVYGTLYDDTLYGHNILSDEIRGLSGGDLLYGLGGNDQIYGGDGNDTLIGGKGDDVLYGGNGNDVLNGRTGEDDLRGGAGNDSVEWRQ